MVSVWAAGVGQSLDEALEVLAAAVRDCPDDKWRVPMWPVRSSEIIGEVRDADDRLVADPAQRDALIQRWSAPWSVAWHALEVLDYDLAGELQGWAPPPPFVNKPHWQTFSSLSVPWSQSQIGQYVEYCKERVHSTLNHMSEERAATRLPPAHRYGGEPYAWVVTRLVGHTTAHAMQIRQSATASALPDA